MRAAGLKLSLPGLGVLRVLMGADGLITYYVSQAAAWWRKAFDFVDSDDEAVVRKFFPQMIEHLSQLMDEERGA